MKNLTKFFLILFPFLLNAFTGAIIKIDNNADHIKQFAANELKKHLELILDEKVIITSNEKLNTENFNYIFHITKENKNLKHLNQDSEYEIKDKNIYIRGNDKIIKLFKTPLETSIYMRNQVGSLFSVYDFLQNELNVKWLKPGNDGIIYKKLQRLDLKNKMFSWNSKYSFRVLRNDIWDYKKFVNKLKMDRFTPKELQFSQDEVKIKEHESLLWKRRMKLGILYKPVYGHAFTKYWNKYGEIHPEWFALGKNTKRGMKGFPKLDENRQKFCVSNTILQDEIINNWKRNYERNGNNIYNASINDSRGYCTCDNCKLLDSEDHIHKEFQEKSKTDRYVYFWNSLLKKAKFFNPDAKIIAYAYSDYRYPPRKERLSDDIILGIVPNFNDFPKNMINDLNNWKEKGLVEIFLRPNDFNDDIGLPMGHEKYIFDKFKVFKGTEIIGLDYDNAYSFNDWNFEGISRYILLQAFNNPKKSFEELENEYYDVFGSSKKDIKEFYMYWRNNFEIKRLPQIKYASGFQGRRYLSQNTKDFFNTKDFDTTNKILENALKNADSENIKILIQNIIISNNHAKFTFKSLISNSNYKKLVKYRVEHKERLSLCWPQVFNSEKKLSSSTYLEKIYSKISSIFE